MVLSSDSQNFSAGARPQELKLSEIKPNLDISNVVASFVPTPRFAHTTFSTYTCDPAFPMQSGSIKRLETFTQSLSSLPLKRSWLSAFKKNTDPLQDPKAIYIDGPYGIGKTHLLAAAYLQSQVPKLYLSFQELVFTIGAIGMQPSMNAFSQYKLICIDEFELDDGGNTMMVASFLRGMFEGTTHIITTSNTIPAELGQGRFAAQDFKREIGKISDYFEVLHIDGNNFRRNKKDDNKSGYDAVSKIEIHSSYSSYQPLSGAKVLCTFQELCEVLERMHPFRYTSILEPVEALFIEDLQPFNDQAMALRFVHFIDKAYDQLIAIKTSLLCPLEKIFPDEYLNGGYAKKFLRCLSRLEEILNS